MAYRVYANHPQPIRLGAEGTVFHPTEPIEVEKLTPDMEFYKGLLRIEEVDDDGEPIVAPVPPAPVSVEDHEKVVKEAESLAKRLNKANEDLKAKDAEIVKLKADHKAEIEALKKGK